MAMRQLYSIRDNETSSFMDLFCETHDVEAKRQFIQVVNNPKTKINQFPRAFELYRLGTMECSTGRLVSLEIPERICSAFECLNSNPEVK